MAASQNVGSQFTGALTFGEDKDEIDEFFKKNFLMPDDFAEIGAVDGALALRRASCLEDESVVRNYLRPNESAFYISAAKDLTAREMIKRVEPVEFFYWMLHFDSENNRWSELGTEVIPDNTVNSVVEEKLDEYVVKAGEPVLVYIFGLRTDEDVEMRLQDGQLERQVIIKHCENSFPDDVFELSGGWNLTVADLVPIASDPKAQNAFAIDFLEGVSAVNLNGVQALANQFEGVLNWVLYDTSIDREGFDIENSNLPRIVFDLLSDPEVDTSGADEMLTIAEFELLPFNSPNIASITLEALNLGGVNFDQLFENIAFKINDRFVGSATDLASDMLVMPVNLNSDDIFSVNPATLKIMATPAARLAVENLVLKLSLDLQSQRVASTIMPPLMIEFESILAKTALVDPNDAIELNDLNLPPSATGFNLNVEIANDTSNKVTISDIRIPIITREGLESLNMIEGPNLLATSGDLDEVDSRVAFDDKNIYLFPGREVNLSRKQKRMLSLSFFFDHDDINDLNLEFGPIEMNTNSVNYKVLDTGEVLTWSGGSEGQTTDSESNTDSDSDENLGTTTTGESDTDGDGLPSFGNDTTTDSESDTDSDSDENSGTTTTGESSNDGEGDGDGDGLPSFGNETTTDSDSDSNENEGEADQDGQEQNDQQRIIVPDFNSDNMIVVRLYQNQQSDRFNWVYNQDFLEQDDSFETAAFGTREMNPLYLGDLNLGNDFDIRSIKFIGPGSELMDAVTLIDGQYRLLENFWNTFDGAVYIRPRGLEGSVTLDSLSLQLEVNDDEIDIIQIELPSIMAVNVQSEFYDIASHYDSDQVINVSEFGSEISLLEYEHLVPGPEDLIELTDREMDLPEVTGVSFVKYYHSVSGNREDARLLNFDTPRLPDRFIEYLNIIFDESAVARLENGDELEISLAIADKDFTYKFRFGSTSNQEPPVTPVSDQEEEPQENTRDEDLLEEIDEEATESGREYRFGGQTGEERADEPEEVEIQQRPSEPEEVEIQQRPSESEERADEPEEVEIQQSPSEPEERAEEPEEVEIQQSPSEPEERAEEPEVDLVEDSLDGPEESVEEELVEEPVQQENGSSGSENVSDKRLAKLKDNPEFQKMLDKLDEGPLVESMLSSVKDLDELISLLKAEGLSNWVEYVSQYR